MDVALLVSLDGLLDAVKELRLAVLELLTRIKETRLVAVHAVHLANLEQLARTDGAPLVGQGLLDIVLACP